MNMEAIVEEGRRYLSLSMPEEYADDWTDERVLKAVNRLYFGGIQAFARYVDKKRGTEPPTSH